VSGRYDINEMRLAAQLAESAPDNSITLFDKGFYSLWLLQPWHSAGENRHWLTPLKKTRSKKSAVNSVNRTS
jgi:hypothetical protein